MAAIRENGARDVKAAARAGAIAAPAGAGGPTTPRVTIIFMAASTCMSSSMHFARGTMTMKPEVGLGVVGMNTQTCGSPRRALISGS